MDKKPIIAITGSSGKTTTKEMLASILKIKYKTFKSIANGNDPWYTALYKKDIDSADYEAIVLEYGLTKKNDIKKCCELITPNIGIITNLDYAHAVNFNSDINQLALGKSELINGITAAGCLFVNYDDIQSRLLHTQDFRGTIIMVGFKDGANYQALDVSYVENGMEFFVCLHSGKCKFFIPSLGEHNVYNALFAIAAADVIGIPFDTIAEGLKNYEHPLQRLCVYQSGKIKIIDDTYNAKPKSMIYAIDVLSRIKKGQVIAILGPMIGLGEHSKSQHEIIGEYIASKNIDLLYVLGDEAEYFARGAIKAGFSPDKIHYFSDRKLLYSALLKLIQSDEKMTFLIKGAQKTQDKWRTYGVSTYLRLMSNIMINTLQVNQIKLKN